MKNCQRTSLILASVAAEIHIVNCTCSSEPFRYDEQKMDKYGHWNPISNWNQLSQLILKFRIEILFPESGKDVVVRTNYKGDEYKFSALLDPNTNQSAVISDLIVRLVGNIALDHMPEEVVAALDKLKSGKLVNS